MPLILSVLYPGKYYAEDNVHYEIMLSITSYFCLSFCSHLPSTSHNSTEFDDPALIQNIEKNHVRAF